MRLEPTPKSDHVVQVSARLVTSSRILHLSADELEHAISQEQMENPALEVNESPICLFCGTPLYSQSCSACGRFVQPALAMSESSTMDEAAAVGQWDEQQASYEIYGREEGATTNDDDDLAAILSLQQGGARALADDDTANW